MSENSWLLRELYEQDQGQLIDRLATLLRTGRLAVIFGAGASAGLGLPLWKDLVQGLASEALVSFSDTAIDSMEQMLELTSVIKHKLGDNSLFRDLVKKHLYKSFEGDEDRFLDHRLLVAVGSMLMKSQRGSVSEVLTFNFDDILEQYLGIHGFSTQVICSLPELRRSVDVTIYHPHGFIPSEGGGLDGENSLVLSGDDFDERLADPTNSWTLLTIDLLLRKVPILIGVSPQGPNLGPLILGVRNRLSDARPTAFWFLGGNSIKDAEKVRRWGCVAICVDSYQEIPKMLLSVCRRAGRGITRF